MDNATTPSPDTKDQTAEPPAPEVLQPRVDEADPNEAEPAPSDLAKTTKKSRRNTYKPSHKATFIGLAAVVLVLVINAGIVAFVLKSQSKGKGLSSQGEVTINQGVLDRIGVNRNSIGASGLELVVSPNARFNNGVKVGGNVSIAGGLKINSKFTAADATLTQLEAGNTTFSQLNVNGDTTLTNLNLRNNLQVIGTTKLQGAVTLSQLLTVNNSVNVVGNLSVGGILTTNGLNIRNLVVNSNFTVGGHVITAGTSPAVSAGPGVGNNGTVSMSGNDAAGTVAVNIGTGAAGGILANITFHNKYANIPHVVISPIGVGVGSFFINRSATGFSIGTNGPLSPGGYSFDYIVEQ